MMDYDPSSNLGREALFLQGTNLFALEKYADATAIFRRILNQYDDPETRAELQAKLEYCEKQLNPTPTPQSK
jgi:TolA-binding protein